MWDIAFSKDAQQKYLYVADGVNEHIRIFDRKSMTELTNFGIGGRQPGMFLGVHSIATDSMGNIYTTETYPGKRLQQFVMKGEGPETAAKQGVPVHVLLRALLKRADTRDAIVFASKLSFGGSSNILCGDTSGDIASLEIAPQGFRVVRGDGATLCHTNHFLHPEAAGWQATLLGTLSTEPRLARAREHAAAREKLGLEDVKRLLRDETAGYLSICRQPDPALPQEERIESVASVIMELDKGVMHIAPDVPSRCEYSAISLSKETELV